MKNRILYVITVTALVLGAFSAKTYVDNKHMAAVHDTSIITAVQDIPAEDGALIHQNAAARTSDPYHRIGEIEVPLAGGPGEAVTVAETAQVPDGPGSQEAASAARTSPDEHPDIQKVIDLVNAEREKAGVAPLTRDPGLCSAAGVRARELASSFSHTRPDGRGYETAVDDAGVSYRGVGENVAMGYCSAEEVVSGWMGSEGHRGNILLSNYTSIGVGYYKASDGYCYWAQSFSY